MTELKSDWVKVAKDLMSNPRASMQEVADRTGVPKSTAWYARKRMEEEGLLNTFVFPQLDELEGVKVGLVGGAINGDKEDVIEKVANHPNVWFLVNTIGPHSFTAGIVGSGEHEFQNVIDELRELGAEGDHYGEVIGIDQFSLDPEFMDSLQTVDEN